MGVHRSRDRLHCVVWTGVSAFETLLENHGRMGVEITVGGEPWLPWPTERQQVEELVEKHYRPCLEAVLIPVDILDALEANGIWRGGLRIGWGTRPANQVVAVVLAEHVGDQKRAARIRAAPRELKMQSPGHGYDVDPWRSALRWARDFGRALGRRVGL